MRGRGPGDPREETAQGGGSTGTRGCPTAAPRLGSPCRSLQPSELLEPTVHLPLALLPGPGPALGAEPLQVLLEVLVVHRAVALGLAEALGKQELGSPQCHQGADPSTSSKQGQTPLPGRSSVADTQSPGRFRLQPSKQGLCVQGSHPNFPGREHTG